MSRNDGRPKSVGALKLDLPTEGLIAKIGSLALEPVLRVEYL